MKSLNLWTFEKCITLPIEHGAPVVGVGLELLILKVHIVD